MRLTLLTLLATLLLPTALNAGQRIGELATLPTRQTDRLIIKQRPQSDGRRRVMGAERVTDLGVRAGVALAHHRSMSGNAEVVRLPRRYTLTELGPILELLNSDPDIEYAEPDLPRYPLLSPNDTNYDQQWHYHDAAIEPGAVNLPSAWDITTGSGTVVVAILDTGLLSHADIVADDDILNNNDRVLRGYDFIDDLDTANDGDGRDNDPTDPGDWVVANECGISEPAEDSSWHGTHVTGTIGALSDNLFKVAGVDWNARLLPLRVLGKCGGWTADIADAMRWAVGISIPGIPDNPNPAKILNLSLGSSDTCSDTEKGAISDVIATGAIVVVAAGNSDLDLNTNNYSPANCNNVITVAAVNRTGGKASFSNYGTTVEIAAPGSSILSTSDSGTTNAANDNVLAYMSGTSMATPHVAGIASLMLAVNDTLTPAQLLSKLQLSARPFPTGTTADCTTSTCGAGIVNAYAAVGCARPATDPTANAGDDLSADPGANVQLSGSVTDDCASTFGWSQTGGAAATITNGNTSTPTVTVPNSSGTITIELTATDDESRNGTDSIVITINNVAPVLATIGDRSITAGNTLSFTVSAIDPNGTIPSHSITGLPPGASYSDNGNGSASFSWTTTDGDINSYTLTFTTTDGALSDSETITITVVAVAVATEESSGGGGGGGFGLPVLALLLLLRAQRFSRRQ